MDDRGEVSDHAPVGSGGHRRFFPVGVAIAVAAAIPRVVTAGNFQTVDESLWMWRSHLFAEALADGRLSHMAVTSVEPATMPGITTMWIGAAARGIFEVAKVVGLIPDGRIFPGSTQGVAIAQTLMALVTAALVGLTAWLVARWASWRVGVAFGLVLATSPFWVAHGAVLHTDELVALFGLSGLLCLAMALDVPRAVGDAVFGAVGEAAPLHRRWLVAAGMLSSCAVLTKLSGLLWVAGGVVIIVWAVVSRIGSREPEIPLWSALRPVGVGVALVAGAGLATVAVLYPALWADPGGQVARLADSLGLGAEPRRSFFRGQEIEQPPTYFYLYVLPWKLTAWSTLLVAIGVPVALVRRVSQSRAVLACAVALPTLIVLSLAAAKYPRYGLSILAPVVLAGCLALQPRAQREAPELRARAATPSRLERRAWLAAGVAGVVFAASVAPWGLHYFNPLLGGGERAQFHVPVGWHEEGETALAAIELDIERRGGTCEGVTSTGYRTFLVTWSRCGTWVPDVDADYLVVGIKMRQRLSPAELRERVGDRERVATVKVRGIRYVELWRRPPSNESS